MDIINNHNDPVLRQVRNLNNPSAAYVFDQDEGNTSPTSVVTLVLLSLIVILALSIMGYLLFY